MAPDNKTAAWGTDLNTAVAGHTLQFDPSAAQKGMEAAGKVILAMRGFRRAVDDLGLTKLPNIGNMKSGELLATALSTRGFELQTAFDRHISILEAMVDTFRAAGKAYKDTDGLSAEQLDKAGRTIPALDDYKLPKTDDFTPVGIDTKNRQIGLIELGKIDHDLPDSVKKWRDQAQKSKDPGGALGSIYIDWENGGNQGWDPLIGLHNTLSNTAGIYYAAQDWKTLADKVHTAVSGFVMDVEAFNNSWHGAGADAARKAVAKYATDTDPLVDTMKIMSQVLDFTAHWMLYVSTRMPWKKDDNPSTCGLGGTSLGDYQNRFDTDYVKNGGKETQNSLPIISPPALDQPKPVDSTGPKTDPNDKKTDPNDKKTDPNDKKTDPSDKSNAKNDTGGGGTTDQSKKTGDAKAAQDAKDAADKKAAADAKAAQDAKDAADKKAADDAKAAADKKAADDAKNAANPNGNGTTPGASLPSTSPSGSTPSTGSTTSPASNASNSGQGLSQLSSLLSGLMSAGTTAAQSLPSLLTALDTALKSGDTGALAQLLGVPEDKVTAAMAQIKDQPDKLAELSQLLGLTSGQTPVVPAAGLPGDVTPAGAAVVTPASAAVATTPAGGLTNLFPRAGLDTSFTQPVFGVTADLSDNPMMAGVKAGADHEPPPVDFLSALAHIGEPPPVAHAYSEADPVVEA